MGIMNHNAVIATTWNQDEINRIKKWVESLDANKSLLLFGPETINGITTVIAVPDGSKEGWAESDAGDMLRKNFISEIKKANHDDGSNPWDWVEIGYGEFGQKVLRGNCENCFSAKDYEV